MKIKIKDQELELHYSMRIYIIYENVVGSSLQNIDPNSVVSSTALIYATIVSTLKYNKIDDTISYDDVVNLIDDNGGMVFIAEFSKWFTDKVNTEAEMIAKMNEPDTKKKQSLKQ